MQHYIVRVRNKGFRNNGGNGAKCIEAFGNCPWETLLFGLILYVAAGEIYGEDVTYEGVSPICSACYLLPYNSDLLQMPVENLNCSRSQRREIYILSIAPMAPFSPESFSSKSVTLLPMTNPNSTSKCVFTPRGRRTGPDLGGRRVVGGLRKKKGCLGAVFLSSVIWSA